MTGLLQPADRTRLEGQVLGLGNTLKGFGVNVASVFRAAETVRGNPDSLRQRRDIREGPEVSQLGHPQARTGRTPEGRARAAQCRHGKRVRLKYDLRNSGSGGSCA